MALLSFPAKKGEYDIEKERSNNSVGKRIKELRMDHNLQQKELAKLLREQGVDVSTGAVGKWEPFLKFSISTIYLQDSIRHY